MRKILIVLFTFALIAGGTASAQGVYAGLSTGFSSVYGVVGVPVVAHVGIENVGLDNLDVRGDLGFYVTGTGLILGVDALYNYPVTDTVDVYGGLGPRVLVDTSGGGAAFGFSLMGGSEYRFTPRFGVIGEADVTPYIGGGVAVIVGFQLGVNYHFL